MGATVAVTEIPTNAPAAQHPRRRGSLARRLALALLPLVIISLLLMAGAAYLRSRAILRETISRQMTSATLSQTTLLEAWAQDREQQLFLASQRGSLRQAVSLLLPDPGVADDELVEAARDEIEAVRRDQRQGLYTHVLVVDVATGRVVLATNRAWDLQPYAPLASGLPEGFSVQTTPAVDDPLFSPAGFALLTVVPLRSAQATAPDLLLVGVNSGNAIGELLEQLQVFSEQRGVYFIRRGQSSFLVRPDVLVSLPRYAVAPQIAIGVDHPVLAREATPDIQTLDYIDLEGTAVIGSYQWLAGWDMAILNELPQAEVYSELNSLAPFTLILVSATAVLSILIVTLVSNRLLRPLSSLTEFARRMAQGEWSFRAPEDRNDELGLLGESLNRMAEELGGAYLTLEERVEERTRHVRIAADIARAVTSTPDLEELMRRAVDLIRDRFGYYHASIFLVDPSGEKAILRASTGEVGQALIARAHQLPVGSQSIIGWVTSNNQPRVASDVTDDPVHIRNELLPATRSEAAVPLQVGGTVLGALDVQSVEVSAFQPEDIDILQTLADQLSAAIQNARLAQTSVSAAEQARLISRVTSEVSGMLEMGDVLETTAQVLHQALGRSEVVIRMLQPGEELASPDTPPSGVENN